MSMIGLIGKREVPCTKSLLGDSFSRFERVCSPCSTKQISVQKIYIPVSDSNTHWKNAEAIASNKSDNHATTKLQSLSVYFPDQILLSSFKLM